MTINGKSVINMASLNFLGLLGDKSIEVRFSLVFLSQVCLFLDDIGSKSLQLTWTQSYLLCLIFVSFCCPFISWISYFKIKVIYGVPKNHVFFHCTLVWHTWKTIFISERCFVLCGLWRLYNVFQTDVLWKPSWVINGHHDIILFNKILKCFILYYNSYITRLRHRKLLVNTVLAHVVPEDSMELWVIIIYNVSYTFISGTRYIKQLNITFI